MPVPTFTHRKEKTPHPNPRNGMPGDLATPLDNPPVQFILTHN